MQSRQENLYEALFLGNGSSIATHFPQLHGFLAAAEHKGRIITKLSECLTALDADASASENVTDDLYNFLVALPANPSTLIPGNPLARLADPSTLKDHLKNALVHASLAAAPAAPALDDTKREEVAIFFEGRRSDLARIFDHPNHKDKIAQALNDSNEDPTNTNYQAKLDEFAACTNYADIEKMTEKLGLPNDRHFINDVIKKNRKVALKAKLDSIDDDCKKAFLDNDNNKKSAKENSEILNRRQPDDVHGGLNKIKTIEEWAAFAPYIASRVTDTPKLNQCADTAYALKTKLEVLKKQNEAHKQRCVTLEADPQKADKKALYTKEIEKTNNRINKLNIAINRVNNAMDNIAEARACSGIPKKTAYYSSMGNATAIHAASTEANENYTAAQTAIKDFFGNPHAASIPHITNASGLQTSDNLKLVEAKSIIDETDKVKTGAIQTTFEGPGKYLHRQDLFIDNTNEQSIQLMAEYQGFGFNKLPADKVMHWAMKVVGNYQAFAHTAGEVVTIHTGNFPNACVEAMMIVCKARGIDYMVTGRLMECKVDKLVEKAIKRYDVLTAQRGDVRQSDRLMSQKVEDTQLAPPPSMRPRK